MADRRYARVEWSIGDVQTLRPSWTDDQAEAWLSYHQHCLQDAMINCGWTAIEALLPPATDADVEDDE